MEYVTPADMATAWNDANPEATITTATVRYQCRIGKIPGAQPFNGVWLIPADAAVTWLETFKRYGRDALAPTP